MSNQSPLPWSEVGFRAVLLVRNILFPSTFISFKYRILLLLVPALLIDVGIRLYGRTQAAAGEADAGFEFVLSGTTWTIVALVLITVGYFVFVDWNLEQRRLRLEEKLTDLVADKTLNPELREAIVRGLLPADQMFDGRRRR
jgi:hypothetical protein